MRREDYVNIWKDLEYVANKLENISFADKLFVGKKLDISQKKIESVIGQMSTGPNWHRRRP